MGQLGLFQGDCNTQKGRFVPKNPRKYIGNPTSIYFRSSWERAVCFWCDTSPQVEMWGSEEIIVPYLIDEGGKKRVRKYYIDFVIRIKRRDGLFETFLIEVKPSNQISKPVVPLKEQALGRLSKGTLLKVWTYHKNQIKWEAAIRYAKINGMIFQIWSEKVLKEKGIL